MRQTVVYGFVAAFSAMVSGQSLALDVGVGGSVGGVGGASAGASTGGGGGFGGGAGVAGGANVGGTSFGRSANVGVGALSGPTDKVRGKTKKLASKSNKYLMLVVMHMKKFGKDCSIEHNHPPDLTRREIVRLRARCSDAYLRQQTYSRDALAVCELLRSL